MKLNLAVIAFCLSPPALAGASPLFLESKAVECAMLLQSAQLASIEEQQGRQNVVEAYGNLHSFRSWLAPHQSNKSINSADKFESVFGTSEEAAPVSKIVSRLNGIEIHWGEKEKETSTNVNFFGRVATQDEVVAHLTDEEKIQSHLEAAAQWKVVYRENAPRLTFNVFRLVSNFFARIDFKAEKKTQQTRAFLAKRKPDSWLYRGETFFVEQEFLTWLQQRDLRQPPRPVNIFSVEHNQQIFDNSRLREVAQELHALRQAIVPRGVFENPAPGKVYRILYIDELLMMNGPSSGEVTPELTVLVRVAKEKTRLVNVQDTSQSPSNLVPVRSEVPIK